MKSPVLAGETVVTEMTMARINQEKVLGTTWTSSAGVMTFFLPDRSQRSVDAEKIDRPMTLCVMIDSAFHVLSSYERGVLVAVIRQFESTKS